MDLPRGQFECIIHTFCVLSLPRPTRLFSRQTTAKCVHMFDSGIRNFNQNHIERAYAARARKKRFLKSDRKEKGAQIELKKCFLNYTNVTHGIPVSWNIQALPLSLLFFVVFFFFPSSTLGAEWLCALCHLLRSRGPPPPPSGTSASGRGRTSG